MKTKTQSKYWKHYLKDSEIIFTEVGFTWVGKEAKDAMFRLQEAQRDNHLFDFDNLALKYLERSPLWVEIN